MRHLVFCISGFSGSGKDAITSHIIDKYGGIRAGLVDPAKRYISSLYGFTQNQLFGPSSARNCGDIRLPKKEFKLLKESDINHNNHPEGLSIGVSTDIKYYEFEMKYDDITFLDLHKYPHIIHESRNVTVFVEEGDPNFWLSPREVLQKHCENMNSMYLNTWVDKCIQIHKKLSIVNKIDNWYSFHEYSYDQMKGLIKNDSKSGKILFDGTIISCIPDLRHFHEIIEINLSRDEIFNPIILKVDRAGIELPPYDHRSETEQTKIPDEAFDYVIHNDSSLHDLHVKIDIMMNEVIDSEWYPTRTTIIPDI